MAGNSSIYELRKRQDDDNLKRWQDWSVSINYVVEQFNDVISNLTERLDMAESAIEALKFRIDNDNNYVKLQNSELQIPSSDKSTYSRPCGVFSNVQDGANIFYAYSNKTISGLYLNDIPVKYIENSESLETTSNTADSTCIPFASFSGSETGTILTFKTDNATKISGDIKIYFSLNSSLNFNNITDDNTDILTLKINYGKQTTKSLYTLDKSKLSKVLIKNTAMVEQKESITKTSANIGQYSTVKTVASVAEQQSSVSSSRTLGSMQTSLSSGYSPRKVKK